MTALQFIIKEAKIIRKKYPNKEWKECVAQASAIYASKHKGKSPVGKKKAVKKVAKKKIVKKKVAKKKVSRKKIGNYKEVISKGKEYLQKGANYAQKKLVQGKKAIANSVINKTKELYIGKNEKSKLSEAQKLINDRYIGSIKRKPSEKDVLKSINKAAKVQKQHMSIGSIKKDMFSKFMQNDKMIDNYNMAIIMLQKKMPKLDKNQKLLTKQTINKFKRVVSELKTHGKELKKHI